MGGPLSGVRVVELAGLGPVPFAAMLLADMGADVVRVDRVGDVAEHPDGPHPDVVARGRRSIAVDLKSTAGRAIVLDLVAGAGVLLEGFRPGVTERLGLGPEACLAVNERLVYGRMTGWGQHGPIAHTAGHDLTYLAVTGALDGSRRAGQRPVPPMNLLGDLGGGALYLALGVVSALLETAGSGRGQVVDAAIVDGTASLLNFILGWRALGRWGEPPGHNLLDTGTPYYDVYICADGRELAVGPIEAQFYRVLLEKTANPDDSVRAEHRDDRDRWSEARQSWAALFATRTRDEWVELLQDSDACIAPVLSMDEAVVHPQLAARGTFLERDGLLQAAPAPRFSRTGAELDRPPVWPGQHTDELLAELGWDAGRIARHRDDRTVG